MRIQCSCGCKYDIEVQPEMREHPVRFVCSNCGRDASDFVNALIQRELEGSAEPSAPPAAAPAAATVQAPAAIEPAPLPHCSKHPGQVAHEKCRVCGKPICPRCMELLGYVCSPLCRARAVSHGIHVPVYAGQTSVREARRWKILGGIAAGLGAVLLLLAGAWGWYALWGSKPRVVFSVRFPNSSYSGTTVLAGGDHSQLIFLHGSTLARYDLKTGKAVWSQELLDPKELEAALTGGSAATANSGEKASSGPQSAEGGRFLSRLAEANLSLHLWSNHIWIACPGQLYGVDWNNGQTRQALSLQSHLLGRLERDGELDGAVVTRSEMGLERVNLLTGEVTQGVRKQIETRPSKLAEALAVPAAAREQTQMTSANSSKPLDPARVEEQVSHLSTPERISLPALVGVSANQERLMMEMREVEPLHPGGAGLASGLSEHVSPVVTRDGLLLFGVRLLEQRLSERNAMKEKSAKTVFTENLTAGQSMEAANEVLNDMQRARGGDKVVEDVSRYAVTVRWAEGGESWTREVIGPPAVFPLATVTVVGARDHIWVLDKANHMVWESALSYPLCQGMSEADSASMGFGQGPCVERQGLLYVCDRGVLTAFDLEKGFARWRLPTVGLAGLFFDEESHLYVNTTTANLDVLRYSRQIDLTRKVRAEVLAVEPASGKILWKRDQAGLLTSVRGAFLYTLESYQPDESEADGPLGQVGLANPAYMRLRRLDPRTGGDMWDYFEQRAPLDAQFERNTICLVFKKEVEVLKFLAF